MYPVQFVSTGHEEKEARGWCSAIIQRTSSTLSNVNADSPVDFCLLHTTNVKSLRASPGRPIDEPQGRLWHKISAADVVESLMPLLGARRCIRPGPRVWTACPQGRDRHGN